MKILRLILLILVVLSAATALTFSLKIHPNPDDERYTGRVQPLLKEYCYTCHSDAKAKADLNLESFKRVDAVLADRDLWMEVMRSVSHHVMPPENKPQPTLGEREVITAWIDSVLFKVDCDQPDPGRVTIRRLNREEYNNTIRDLVGVDLRPADNFPADDTGYGFDNIGDVLSLSPLLVEKYLLAADQVLNRVLSGNRVESGVHSVPLDRLKKQGGIRYDSGALVFYSNGEAHTLHDFPAEAEYAVRIRAWASRGGNEPARMQLRLQDRGRQVTDVKAPRSKPGVYRKTFKAPKGKQQIGVAFINDYYNPKHPDPNRRDRNLIVEAIEIEGPLNLPPPPPSEPRQKVLVCEPDPNRPETHRACARDNISHFARRAFRRPVTAAEVDRLLNLYDMARDQGDDFGTGIKLALQAVLVSPHFLFRGEIQADPHDPKSVRRIGEHELASRLSYFLWSSMPDPELDALADNQQLGERLEEQVERMLKDPRAKALAENFAGQWLQIRDVQMMTPDPNLFPTFDEALRDAMYSETERCFRYIQEEDRNILEFIRSDYTFLNEKLARHYGIEGIKGKECRRVQLNTPRRGGVLTHAGILTLTSNPTRTSPVKRGKWILENILGTPPPPPPEDVPTLEESVQGNLTAMTLREQLEKHREDPVCASCHTLMDPIGFAFEHYDAIGAWRDRDGQDPIDSSDKLKDGTLVHGAPDLINYLVERKKDQFVRCMAEHMLTYALGRGLEYYDRCALDDICEYVAEHDYRFSSLVTAVVKSVPFRMYRGDPGERGAEFASDFKP